jgi:hypothetical protein
MRWGLLINLAKGGRVRFPKELIGSVRRGELTVLRRPVNGRPCPFKSGRFYVLERVEDRHESACPTCSGEGCEECGDHGTLVTYQKRATTLDDEYVEITEVARQPLHWADDSEAESWGFETREDYIEDWQERHRSGDTYLVRFTYATDMPNLLAGSRATRTRTSTPFPWSLRRSTRPQRRTSPSTPSSATSAARKHASCPSGWPNWRATRPPRRTSWHRCASGWSRSRSGDGGGRRDRGAVQGPGPQPVPDLALWPDHRLRRTLRARRLVSRPLQR